MNFYEYQKKAMRTANFALSDNDQLLNAALGLSGESGEFAGLVSKFYYQDNDFDKQKLISKLGNVIWYAALVCESMSIDLEDIAAFNIEKLEKLNPETFAPNHSIERVDEEL